MPYTHGRLRIKGPAEKRARREPDRVRPTRNVHLRQRRGRGAERRLRNGSSRGNREELERKADTGAGRRKRRDAGLRPWTERPYPMAYEAMQRVVIRVGRRATNPMRRCIVFDGKRPARGVMTVVSMRNDSRSADDGHPDHRRSRYARCAGAEPLHQASLVKPVGGCQGDGIGSGPRVSHPSSISLEHRCLGRGMVIAMARRHCVCADGCGTGVRSRRGERRSLN
jgi:hypothetical protein